MSGTTYEDCGTITAYNRHRRARENPCEPCRRAKKSEKTGTAETAKKTTEKAARATSGTFAETLAAEPDVTENLDRLAELREALKGVRAAMRCSSPMHIAGLSKERRDLAKEIEDIENPASKAEEEDPLEALLKM